MACKFSFFLSFTDARRETDVGVFYSDSGDVYKIKYKSNVSRDLVLIIDWKTPKRILLTVKLYSTSFSRCFSSKGMVINGKKAFMKLRGAFNVSNSRDYKVLCVVSLIPYIKFNNNSEQPTELFKETECVESEQSSEDDDSSVSDGENGSRNEVVDYNREVRNNSMANINEINLPKDNSQSVNKIGNASCKNTDFKTFVGTDEMIIDQSIGTNSKIGVSDNIDVNVSQINRSISNSIYQADKIIKNDNVSESSMLQHDSINIKNLENNFSNIIKDLINGNCDEQRCEFKLSDAISTEKNTVIRNNTNEPIVISKLLTLDDSEKAIENMKAINFHEIVESIDRFSENNLSMDVDFLEPSLKCPILLCNEDKSLYDLDRKEGVSFSENITPKISQREKTEFIVFGNEELNLLQEVFDSHIESDSTKTNTPLESKVVSVKASCDKERADISSKCNTQTKIENSVPSKKENVDSYTFLKSGTSSVNNINSPELKTPEINNAIMDSHNVEWGKISSSKTVLVFRSLVQMLNEVDSDTQSKNVENNADRISGKSLQIPLGSPSDKNKNFPVIESEIKGLSLDMLDLLISGDMFDSEITNGENHIKVHRAIISARSSCLKKLFIRHMNYSTADISYSAMVNIPSYILEDVVLFLYVGVIIIKSTKMNQDLYQVAIRYCISDLIDICSKHT